MSKENIWHNNDEEERTYPDFIRETQAAYKVSGSPALARLLAKTQGQYTVEDYYALPDDCRVELIDGVIYNLAAPSWQHQNIAGEIFYYLKDYIKQNNGSCIAGMSPADVQLDKDDKTMVQPDIIVTCRQDKIREKVFYGAPDMVIEVLSPSNGQKEQQLKYQKYKDAGVREYWVVHTDRKHVTVNDFEGDKVPVVYSFQDKIPVHIFHGELEIDFAELYREISFLF